MRTSPTRPLATSSSLAPSAFDAIGTVSPKQREDGQDSRSRTQTTTTSTASKRIEYRPEGGSIMVQLRRRLLGVSVLVVVLVGYLFLPYFVAVLHSFMGKRIDPTAFMDDIVSSGAINASMAVHELGSLSWQYQTLAGCSDAILEEFESFRRLSRNKLPLFRELDSDQQSVDPQAQWNTLWVKAYGIETDLARFFPTTIKAVQDSGAPAVSIMLSRLAPSHNLQPHRGPTSAVLRYHLGLKIPTDVAPKLIVSPCRETASCVPKTLTWRQGDGLLFDDSYYHMARNRSPNQERVILWLDLKRHDLSWRAQLQLDLGHWLLRNFPAPQLKSIVESTNQQMQALGLSKRGTMNTWYQQSEEI